MIHYVAYNPDTGKISGRIRLANPAQAEGMNYLLEITESEWNAQPEIHKKVNLETMTLEDKEQGARSGE